MKAKEKKVAEDEMVGWHHQFNRNELGQTPGDGEGQGGLKCCSPWGCKESDTTYQQNHHHPASEGSKHVQKKKKKIAVGLVLTGTQVFIGYPRRGLSGYIE